MENVVVDSNLIFDSLTYPCGSPAWRLCGNDLNAAGPAYIAAL